MSRSDLSPLEDELWSGGMSLQADSGLPIGDIETLRPKVVRVIQDAGGGWTIEWERAGAEVVTLEHDPSDCLRDYLALGLEGGPENILAFVQKYGVMGRCEHWSLGDRQNLCGRCDTAEVVREIGLSYGAFPFLFNLLLKGAASSQQGKTLPDELCEILAHLLNVEVREIQSDEYSYIGLAGVAFTIIGPTLGTSLRPGLYFDLGRGASNHGPVSMSFIRFGIYDLFGVLVVKLAAVLSSANGVFMCSFCRSPFWPEDGQYRPRRNQRQLCSDVCRRGIRAQDAREKWLRDHAQQQRKSKYRRTASAAGDSAVP